MRKSILSIMLLFAISMAASAQKFALIDTEYILKNIPAYQSANEQLQQATKKYQGEVEAIAKNHGLGIAQGFVRLGQPGFHTGQFRDAGEHVLDFVLLLHTE